jgi:hypothetical protein
VSRAAKAVSMCADGLPDAAHACCALPGHCAAGFPQLYGYMLSQRRKIIGGRIRGSGKLKPS